VLLQNPYLLQKDDVLKAQVFFMGKPLTNKLITARNRTGSEPATAFTSRTNANGICSFQIKRKGDWFIHSTLIIPARTRQMQTGRAFGHLIVLE